jgi:hypothetical protein
MGTESKTVGPEGPTVHEFCEADDLVVVHSTAGHRRDLLFGLVNDHALGRQEQCGD